ncbi:unnamed protein product [Closterium sp. Naga37s-1]|nr:unnamed protein product [Closterium sp. Naga37s-1]
MELSGNKVRKLEFLLADALAKGADTLITIGGIQSNHCRATAVAARLAGLEAHLILRTSRALADSDPGLEGNLLVERMVGARVHLVTKEEYAKHGSEHLGKVLALRLAAEGRKPYVIPVGGSNALGTCAVMKGETIGGMRACVGVCLQLGKGEAGGASGFDDIAMACGSGSTSAGLALGVHLSSLSSTRVHAYFVGGTSAGLALGVHLSSLSSSCVHAYSVCDSPAYFYDYIQGLLDGVTSKPGSVDSLNLARVIEQVKGAGYAISTEEELQLVKGGRLRYQHGGGATAGAVAIGSVKGAGYAISTEEELRLVQSVAQSTGIVLDPVYRAPA